MERAARSELPTPTTTHRRHAFTPIASSQRRELAGLSGLVSPSPPGRRPQLAGSQAGAICGAACCDSRCGGGATRRAAARQRARSIVRATTGTAASAGTVAIAAALVTMRSAHVHALAAEGAEDARARALANALSARRPRPRATICPRAWQQLKHRHASGRRAPKSWSASRLRQAIRQPRHRRVRRWCGRRTRLMATSRSRSSGLAQPLHSMLLCSNR